MNHRTTWQPTDSHGWFAGLREQAPVARVANLAGLDTWLITRDDDVRQVLKDPRISKDFRGCPHVLAANEAIEGAAQRTTETSPINWHMLFADPPTHTRLRRLVQQAFSPARMKALRPRIEQLSQERLDALGERTEFDLMDAYARPFPLDVISELLGVPHADRPLLQRWATVVNSGSAREKGEVADAVRQMYGYVETMLDSGLLLPADEQLAGLFTEGVGDGRTAKSELIALVCLFINAGHDTTTNLIGNGMHALLTHPEQLAALRASPDALPGAVEELLRYDGPVNTSTLRFTTEPMPVGEVTVPAGQLVYVSLLSANRDRDRWPDADRLDLTRATSGHLAFGHGIHHCLGAPLARLEAQIAFRQLLDRFPHLELAVPAEQLQWRPATLIRGLERLPVTTSAPGAKRG